MNLQSILNSEATHQSPPPYQPDHLNSWPYYQPDHLNVCLYYNQPGDKKVLQNAMQKKMQEVCRNCVGQCFSEENREIATRIVIRLVPKLRELAIISEALFQTAMDSCLECPTSTPDGYKQWEERGLQFLTEHRNQARECYANLTSGAKNAIRNKIVAQLTSRCGLSEAKAHKLLQKRLIDPQLTVSEEPSSKKTRLNILELLSNQSCKSTWVEVPLIYKVTSMAFTDEGYGFFIHRNSSRVVFGDIKSQTFGLWNVKNLGDRKGGFLIEPTRGIPSRVGAAYYDCFNFVDCENNFQESSVGIEADQEIFTGAFLPEKKVALGCTKGTLKIFDLANGNKIIEKSEKQDTGSRIFSLAFDYEKDILCHSIRLGIRIIDMKSENLSESTIISLGNGAARIVKCYQNFVAFGQELKQVNPATSTTFYQDIRTKNELIACGKHQEVNTLHIDGARERMVVSYDEEMAVWDLRQPAQPLHEVRMPETACAAFSKYYIGTGSKRRTQGFYLMSEG